MKAKWLKIFYILIAVTLIGRTVFAERYVEEELADDEEFVENTNLSVIESEEADGVSGADESLENYDPDMEEVLKEPVELMSTAPLYLTLEDCVRMALEHNAKLQATGYNIDAAKAQLQEASMFGWPIFNYEYKSAPIPDNVSTAIKSFFGGDWSWWNQMKIGMALPIYSFGKISLAKEIAKNGINGAETQAFQEKNQLISKVKQLYYGVLLAEEVGKLLKEAHNRLKSEYEKRQAASEGQDSEYSPIENLKIKVFLYDLQKRLTETRQKEAQALEALRVQMGLTAGTVFTVYSKKLRPVEAEIKPFQDYLQVAMASRPDAKLLETALEVKKGQYQMEKLKYFPDIVIGAYFDVGRTATKIYGVTATGDFNDPFNYTRAGFGLQLSGKLDLHGNSARLKKARSEYYKLNLEQMIAKEGIKLELKDAFLRVRTAKMNLTRAENAQKTANQLVFLTQSNFEIGVGEDKDYIDALQLLLMTRGRYFEAVFDYNSALAQLDEKIGVIPEMAKQ